MVFVSASAGGIYAAWFSGCSLGVCDEFLDHVNVLVWVYFPAVLCGALLPCVKFVAVPALVSC